MIIRHAVHADTAGLARVIVDSYLSTHRAHLPPALWEQQARQWTYADSAAGWARTLDELAAEHSARQCVMVAEVEGGALIGLAMGGPVGDEAPALGAVYTLYVLPAHQGRGVGRHLLRAVAAHLAAHGMTMLEVGCLTANTSARRFYEACGGQLVGERSYDEGGVLLAGVLYKWANIQNLAREHS